MKGQAVPDEELPGEGLAEAGQPYLTFDLPVEAWRLGSTLWYLGVALTGLVVCRYYVPEMTWPWVGSAVAVAAVLYTVGRWFYSPRRLRLHSEAARARLETAY